MSSIVISGDTSGAITVAVPAVAGTNTVTIAAQTGTLNAAGPAFSAYASSGTVTSTGANTKISFQVEEYDTNNNFASNRFTPTIAGYYQINAAVYWGVAMTTRSVIYVFKNGAATTVGYGSDFGNSNNYNNTLSNLIYANGTTDYFEIYVYQQTGGNLTTGTGSYFQGVLVRGA
jgi:hypothetical protein